MNFFSVIPTMFLTVLMNKWLVFGIVSKGASIHDENILLLNDCYLDIDFVISLTFSCCDFQ